jgi:hypothetical protein
VHLVEVLIAAALLASVCASLPAAFAAAVRGNAAAAQATWTAVLAAQKVEELRSQPFAGLGTGESFDLLDAAGRVVDAASASPAFRRTWRIEPFSVASDQTVVITVVVAPHRRSADHGVDAGGPGATRLVTLRTRKGA